MKNLKLFLDDEEEDNLNLGLLRMAKELPAHEFFYEINQNNPDSPFRRIKDLVKKGRYHDYTHLRFEAHHRESKNCIQLISNHSVKTDVKAIKTELFSDEEDVNFLLPFHKEVDYIVRISDNVADFSLILWPENIMFSIQDYCLSSRDELSELIQYYE